MRMRFSEHETQNILESAVAAALKQGAEHASALAMDTQKNSMRFALNRVTQHQENSNFNLLLTVAVDDKEAIVETNQSGPEAILDLAKLAVQYAAQAPPNPEFVQPISQGVCPKTVTWFNDTAALSLTEKARAINSVCEVGIEKKVNVFGNLNHNIGRIAVANSKYLFLHQSYTEMSFNCTARTISGGGSGCCSAGNGSWHRLNIQETAEKAVDTAVKSQNPISKPPGKYTVIMGPDAALEYLMYLLFAMDSRNAEMGQSFFSDKSNGKTKLGQQLFDHRVTISSRYDHPSIPVISFGTAFGTGGSAAGIQLLYGLPMQNHYWIQDGVLKELMDSPYWALKNNRPLSGCPFTFIMEGNNSTTEQLIASTKQGIYISSFWYTSPTDMNNIELTGLTRDGTFWIENGELTHPIQNFRFNDSPVKSLNQLAGISHQEMVEGEFIQGAVPHLKIEGFNLSSVSDAI